LQWRNDQHGQKIAEDQGLSLIEKSIRKSKFKNLKLHPTCRGTKMGLKSIYENKQFSPPKVSAQSPAKKRPV
jgi:hypothetical protein